MIRLDTYIQEKIQEEYGVKLSRTYVERILEAGGVLLNDEIIKKKGFSFDPAKHHPVLDEKKVKEFIGIYQTGKRQDSEADAWDASEEGIELDEQRVANAADIRPSIIFEDDDILAVYKPPGVSSHPGKGDHGSDSMVYQYIRYMKDIHHYVPRAGLLHRLDKETQGILLFAKNMQTYNEVKAQFETRSIEKYYLATCDVSQNMNNSLQRAIAEYEKLDLELRKIGFAADSGVEQDITTVLETRKPILLDGFIGRRRGTPFMVYTPDSRQSEALVGSKSCSSEVYVVSADENRLKLLFVPHTGRTHQIRAQARYLGASVINDRMYGNKDTLGGTLGLCAVGMRVMVKGSLRSFFVSPK